VKELRGYLFCFPPTAIDSFDSFNIFELADFLLTAAIFQHLPVARPFGTAFALDRGAMVRLSNLNQQTWR
jgi:hypothetical protein